MWDSRAEAIKAPVGRCVSNTKEMEGVVRTRRWSCKAAVLFAVGLRFKLKGASPFRPLCSGERDILIRFPTGKRGDNGANQAGQTAEVLKSRDLNGAADLSSVCGMRVVIRVGRCLGVQKIVSA